MERRPDPLWRQHPARSRTRVVAILVAVVAVYIAFIAVKAPGSCSAPGGGPCGAATTGSQIDVRATPRSALPLAVCLRRERSFYEAGDSLIRQSCAPGRADWYHAVVTYHGPRRWIGCTLVGYDAGGRRLWQGAWGMPMLPLEPEPVAVAVRMHAGQTLTVDYHLPGVSRGGPPGPVARYVAHCRVLPAEPS